MATTYEIGKLQLVIEAMDKNTGTVIRKTTANIKGFTQSVEKTTKQTGLMSKAMGRLVFAIDPVSYAFRFLKKTIGEIYKTAADFEQNIHNVGAVAHATTDELNELSEAAKVQSISDLGYNALQAADAMYIFASAGYDVEESISALEGTLTMAAATGADLNDVGEIMISTIKQFGREAGDTMVIADTFAGVIANSQARIDKLGKSLRYAGAIAYTAGLDLKETATSLGLLYNAGLSASMAGTGFRRVISGLIKPTKEATSILARYGLTYEDINPKINSMRDILIKLAPMVENAGDLMDMFGLRGGPAMAALLRQGTDAFDELYASTNMVGEATWQATMQLDTYRGSQKQLNAEITKLYTNIGSYFLPTLKEGASALATFIKGISSYIGMLKEEETIQDRVTKAIHERILAEKESFKVTDWEIVGTKATEFITLQERLVAITEERTRLEEKREKMLSRGSLYDYTMARGLKLEIEELKRQEEELVGAVSESSKAYLSQQKILEQLKEEYKGTTTDVNSLASSIIIASEQTGISVDIIKSSMDKLDASVEEVTGASKLFGFSIGSLTDKHMEWFRQIMDGANATDVLNDIMKETNMTVEEMTDWFDDLIDGAWGGEVFKSFILNLEKMAEAEQKLTKSKKELIFAMEDEEAKMEKLHYQTSTARQRYEDMKTNAEYLNKTISELYPNWTSLVDINTTAHKEFSKALNNVYNAAVELEDELSDMSSGQANYAEQTRMSSVEGQRLIELFRSGTITMQQLKDAMALVGTEGFDLASHLNDIFGGIEAARLSTTKWGLDVEEFIGDWKHLFDTKILRDFFEQADSTIELTEERIRNFVEATKPTLEDLFSSLQAREISDVIDLGGGLVEVIYGASEEARKAAEELGLEICEATTSEMWECTDSGYAIKKTKRAAEKFGELMSEEITNVTERMSGVWDVTKENACESFTETYQCYTVAGEKILLTAEQYAQKMIDIKEKEEKEKQALIEKYSITGSYQGFEAMRLSAEGQIEMLKKNWMGQWEVMATVIPGADTPLGIFNNKLDNTIELAGMSKSFFDHFASTLAGFAEEIRNVNDAMDEGTLILGSYTEAQAKIWLDYYERGIMELERFLETGSAMSDEFAHLAAPGPFTTAEQSAENSLDIFRKWQAQLYAALYGTTEEIEDGWAEMWRNLNATTITNIVELNDQWIVTKKGACGTWEEIYECVDHQLKKISDDIETELERIDRITREEWNDINKIYFKSIEELADGTYSVIKQGVCGEFEELYECVDGQLQKMVDSAGGATGDIEDELVTMVNIINSLAGKQIFDAEKLLMPVNELEAQTADLLRQLYGDLASGTVTNMVIGGGISPDMQSYFDALASGTATTMPTFSGSGVTTTIIVEEGAIVIQAEDMTNPEEAAAALEIALQQIAIEAEMEGESGVP